MVGIRQRAHGEAIHRRERRGDRIVMAEQQCPEPDPGEEGDDDLAEQQGEADRRQGRQEAEPPRLDGYGHAVSRLAETIRKKLIVVRPRVKRTGAARVAC